jgi:aconitase A
MQNPTVKYGFDLLLFSSTFTPPHILCLQMDVYDAAERYRQDKIPLIALAGKDYGSGSSRDWAANGPFLLVSIYL